MNRFSKKLITIPYLRIEHAPTWHTIRGGGMACLILGRTIVSKVEAYDSTGMAELFKMGEEVRKELARIKVDATETKITLEVPYDSNPIILWPR